MGVKGLKMPFIEYVSDGFCWKTTHSSCPSGRDRSNIWAREGMNGTLDAITSIFFFWLKKKKKC